ncbi:MAG: hypothetical protein DMF97_16225, partial [Acidobacteria bacterium]
MVTITYAAAIAADASTTFAVVRAVALVMMRRDRQLRREPPVGPPRGCSLDEPRMLSVPYADPVP